MGHCSTAVANSATRCAIANDQRLIGVGSLVSRQSPVHIRCFCSAWVKGHHQSLVALWSAALSTDCLTDGRTASLPILSCSWSMEIHLWLPPKGRKKARNSTHSYGVKRLQHSALSRRSRIHRVPKNVRTPRRDPDGTLTDSGWPPEESMGWVEDRHRTHCCEQSTKLHGSLRDFVRWRISFKLRSHDTLLGCSLLLRFSDLRMLCLLLIARNAETTGI